MNHGGEEKRMSRRQEIERNSGKNRVKEKMECVRKGGSGKQGEECSMETCQR